MTHPIRELWLQISDEYWNELRDLDERLAVISSNPDERIDWERLIPRNKERAYCKLKKETGQDFGFDLKAWENWLRKNTDAWDY